MHKKQLRIRYIRTLETFFSKTINLLKLNNFNFELFKIRTNKNYKNILKVNSVELSSSYFISLKAFINKTLNFLEYHTSSFEKERNILLRDANLLQKEKNRNMYLKDKHKNSKFNDDY